MLVAERTSAGTQILSSLEFFASLPDQRTGGLNDWTLGRQVFTGLLPRMTKIIDTAGQEKTEKVIHGLRVIAGLSLYLPARIRKHRSLANTFLAGSSLLLHPKHFYGSDGSDQLSFLVQSTAAIARIGDNDRRLESGLMFLSSQVALSYLTSGAVKMVSRTWRSGEALPGVLRTRTYGDAKLFQFLDSNPRISKTIAHSVLAAEICFPLVYVMPRKPALAAVTTMGVFHIANARYMGLARFVWAFLATYPAVVYVILKKDRGVGQ